MGVITNDTRTEAFKRKEAGLPPLQHQVRVNQNGKNPTVQQEDGRQVQVKEEENFRQTALRKRLLAAGIDLPADAFTNPVSNAAITIGVAGALGMSITAFGRFMSLDIFGKDKVVGLKNVEVPHEVQNAKDIAKFKKDTQAAIKRFTKNSTLLDRFFQDRPDVAEVKNITPEKKAEVKQLFKQGTFPDRNTPKNSLQVQPQGVAPMASQTTPTPTSPTAPTQPQASLQRVPQSPQTQGFGGQRVTASMADKFAGANSQLQGPLQQQNTSAPGFNDLGREDARLVREQNNPQTRYVDKPLADKGQLRQQVTRLGKPQVAPSPTPTTATAPTPKPTGSFTAPKLPKPASPMVSVGGNIRFSPVNSGIVSTLKGGIVNAVVGAFAQPHVEAAGEFLGDKLAEGIWNVTGRDEKHGLTFNEFQAMKTDIEGRDARNEQKRIDDKAEMNRPFADGEAPAAPQLPPPPEQQQTQSQVPQRTPQPSAPVGAAEAPLEVKEEPRPSFAPGGGSIKFDYRPQPMRSQSSPKPQPQPQQIRDYGSKDKNLAVWAKANRGMIEKVGTKQQRDILSKV